MLITLASGGSRGDTQPYIALALGFKRAGHQVRFLTTPDFASMVDEAGFDCRFVSFDIRSLLESESGAEVLTSGGNPIRFIKKFWKMAEPVFEQSLRFAQENYPGSDGVIIPSTGAIFGREPYDRLGVRYCYGYLQPVTRTNAFVHPFFPQYARWLPVGKQTYNKFSYKAFDYVVQRLVRKPIRRALDKTGLPSQPSAGFHSIKIPLLYGFSPEVIKPPADWLPHVHVTGYWFLNQTHIFKPSPDLIDFLNCGPAPVYIGFGSMNNRNPKAMTNLVVEALRLSRQRGVLITGWGGMEKTELPDFVYATDSMPHDWLFPRVAAVVHHCGAGTTAAGLRAGVPTVPVPFFGDQIFWARRLYELGTATHPIPRKRLTANTLAQAITIAVSNKNMQVRATSLGERIRDEHGVARAVEIAERYFSKVSK
jgi:sterol 3beta-glucosyltransferase